VRAYDEGEREGIPVLSASGGVAQRCQVAPSWVVRTVPSVPLGDAPTASACLYELLPVSGLRRGRVFSAITRWTSETGINSLRPIFKDVTAPE
jgi:hypothetical protein